MINDILSKKLEEISNLELGWDGYDAKPFSEAVLNNTVTVLSNIGFQDNTLGIYPTGRDSIQIEYYPKTECDSDAGVEFEIFDTHAEYSAVRGGEWVIDGDPVTFSDCIAILNNFYREKK